MKARQTRVFASVLAAVALAVSNAAVAIASSGTGAPGAQHASAGASQGVANPNSMLPQPNLAEWGDWDFGQTVVPASLTNVSKIAAGDSFAVALKSDGTLVGWGSDVSHALDFPNPAGPTLHYTAVAAGQDFAVALVSDGSLRAWGALASETTVPTAPVGKFFTTIAASGQHALAMVSDGTVVAWGQDAWGDTDVPVGLSHVTGIAASRIDSFAIKNDGTIVAWGSSDYNMTTVPSLPVGVIYTALWGGWYYGMALRSDGTLVVWGDNGWGEQSPPAGVSDVISVSGGA